MGTDISCAIEVAAGDHRNHGASVTTWKFDRPLELGRNYHLFGILCGYAGFLTPVAEPRGLPTDLDRACRTSLDDDGSVNDDSYGAGYDDEFGDHSYSWLTLGELRAYDWERPIADSGLIPLREVDALGKDDPFNYGPFETYVEWRKTTRHCPRRWIGGSSEILVLDLRDAAMIPFLYPSGYPGSRETSRDRAMAEHLISNPAEMPSPLPAGRALYPSARPGLFANEPRPRTAWALVAWSRPAREACAEFHAWLTAQTAKDDEMRIVFGLSS